MRVLLTPTVREQALQFAKALLPDGFELVLGDPKEGPAFLDKVRQADVIMGYLSDLRPEVWQAAKGRVRLMQMLPAGYERMDLEAARASGVPVALNGGANAVGVAEHAIMLMLAAYRHLFEITTRTRAGGWRPRLDEEIYYELGGKTVGIIGLGNIGFQVAKRVRAFETEVVYFDTVRRPAEDEARLGLRFLALDELIGAADVVTLHTPLLLQTRHLIDARRLALMKPTALLVNTARAELVDEDALVAALDGGRLFGAALDTVKPEPPPPEHPLLHHPKVIVTPHTAGTTYESWPRRFANAYENMARVGRGEAPLWVIPELRAAASLAPERGEA